MLWVPQKGRLLVQHNLGTVGSATPGTSVTTGAAASTKGTPVEVFASTDFDAYLIQVTAWDYAASATNAKCCLDVMVGAATEEIVLPDLFVGHSNNAAGGLGVISGVQYFFPLYIPAGTRLSIRAAGQRVSTAFRVGIRLWGGDEIPPFKVARKVITYGITTVPVGTTLTPGASAAEGAWAEIVASTSEDHFGIMPGFHPGDDASKGANHYFVDLGEGAATEEELLQNYWYRFNTDETIDGPSPAWPHLIDIPSGTRLVMRASNAGTNDAGNYNGVIYGLS